MFRRGWGEAAWRERKDLHFVFFYLFISCAGSLLLLGLSCGEWELL